MSRYVVTATWDDVPHLAPEVQAELARSIPPWQRDARMRGVPQLGAGAIYPVVETDVACDEFALPTHWPRCYGLDVGWQATAAVWGAWNRESDTVYLYAEHLRGEAEPAVHAAAVRMRGAWIPGVIDPASRGRAQKDGVRLLDHYRELGLDLDLADHAVEAGLERVWTRLSTGRLKVFRSLSAWWQEYRIYRRDEAGRVVKQRDHLMDACLTGDTRVQTADGAVPIAQLVGRAGWVVSRAGSLARFCGARLTRRQAPTVRLTFDDGSVVRCTPDHPFLTADGWRRADQMCGQWCYDGIAQRIQWSRSSLPRFKSFRDAATTAADPTSSVLDGACTWLSGSISTGGPFQSDTLSIIGTTTVPTTPQTTWWRCRVARIPASISRAIDAASRVRQWRPHVRGIGLRWAAPGIGSTMLACVIPSTVTGRSFAASAGGRMSRGTLAATVSARMPVRHGRARRAAWTARNVAAWGVAQALWWIVTRGRAAARASARRTCVGVALAPPADVYCLTVPGTASFCLANGAVVHNTRYLVMSGLQRAKVEPVAPVPVVEYVDVGSAQTTWMG